MREMKAAAAVIAGCAALIGCAAADRPAERAETPVLRAGLALIAGAEAYEADNAEGMRAAAGVLESLGARPADGAPDLVEVWSAHVQALGGESIPARGRTAGPAYREGVLAVSENARFNEMFHAGRAAIVSVSPRGGDAFVLQVRSAEGEEICRELVEDGPAECRWTPVWTEQVRIEIANLSGRPAQYFLLTN